MGEGSSSGTGVLRFSVRIYILRLCQRVNFDVRYVFF